MIDDSAVGTVDVRGLTRFRICLAGRTLMGQLLVSASCGDKGCVTRMHALLRTFYVSGTA